MHGGVRAIKGSITTNGSSDANRGTALGVETLVKKGKSITQRLKSMEGKYIEGCVCRNG